MIGLIPLQYQNTYIHFFNTKFLLVYKKIKMAVMAPYKISPHFEHVIFSAPQIYFEIAKVCATMKYKRLAVIHNLNQ